MFRLRAAVALLLAAVPASAIDKYAATGSLSLGFPVGGLLAQSVPTDQIAEGRWNVKLVPALFDFDTKGSTYWPQSFKDIGEGSDASGFGGAFAVVRGFSPKWALGFSALGFSGEGKGFIQRWVPVGGGCTFGDCAKPDAGILVPNKVSGGVANLFVIHDFFGRKQGGFHLLAMVGASYWKVTDSVELIDPSFTAKVEHEFNGPGLAAGLSPQFDLGRWFHFAPFAFVTKPLGGAKHTCTTTGGVACLSEVDTGNDGSGTPGPVIGLDVTFLPLNLGAMISKAPSGKEANVLSLKWSRSFGGD